MATPYDTVIRLQRRTLDAMRVDLATQVETVSRAQAAHAGVEAAMKDAHREAAASPLLPSDRYLARLRHERTMLAAANVSANEQLHRLQARMADAYGKARAIDIAADLYRERIAQQSAAVEQQEMDELAARKHAAARETRP